MEFAPIVPQAMDLVVKDETEDFVEYIEEGEDYIANASASTPLNDVEAMNVEEFNGMPSPPTLRPPQRSLHSSLANREISSRSQRQYRELSIDMAAERLPHIIKENELPGVEKLDKIFSSAWLTPDAVVAGTKDNRLILWHAQTRKHFSISLPSSSKPNACNENCGIHFITINESRTLLATGARDPNHVALFRLPDFTPIQILEGHKDWVFASQFIDDNRLVTASRDTTVNVYNVDSSSMLDVHCNSILNTCRSRRPLATRTEHTAKVRDLQHNPFTGRFATLSADGTTKIWDSARLDVLATVELPENRELVCLANDPTLDLIAVGSQLSITFVDPRAAIGGSSSAAVINKIGSQDEEWGVRSLCFQRSRMLTVGGGMGRLSFFDLRAGKWMPLASTGVQEKPYVATGKGHLHKDATYYEHFSGVPVANAVYTHSYDPTGTRMFVGGGPLMLGLKGCYAAIWS